MELFSLAAKKSVYVPSNKTYNINYPNSIINFYVRGD